MCLNTAVKLSFDSIEFGTYRRLSIAAAGLFVGMFGWTYISVNQNIPEKVFLITLLALGIACGVIAVLLRWAKCPACGTLLGPIAPFRGRCNKCGLILERVSI